MNALRQFIFDWWYFIILAMAIAALAAIVYRREGKWTGTDGSR